MIAHPMGGPFSSPFYVNLLGRWLTNEAFPLKTDAVGVPYGKDDDEDPDDASDRP